MNYQTEFMQRLDTEYRDATGITERRLYSIFYSQVIPSPILILGYNPGGDPTNWDESALASESLYEASEHEYVDCDYKIARAMRPFLIHVLSLASENEIRRIPKTNLLFRRSPSKGELPIGEDEAISESKSILEQILVEVSPDTILFEGINTLDLFEQNYCEDVRRSIDKVDIRTPNGRYAARIYRGDEANVRVLGKSIKLLGIGHPSKFAGRTQWGAVQTAAKQFLRHVAVAT